MWQGQGSPPDVSVRGENMLAPDEVAAMVRLKSLGWGTRKIAAALGCSRTTVKRYVEGGGFMGYRQPRRGRRLDGLDDWLAEGFRQHRGNAEVVRQDLARELGILVSLRTVERAVTPLRQALRAEARACVRFETPPGKQLQIDFGETKVAIGGELVRVHLFVATLGYSRRVYVRGFRHERQSAWFDGLEGAFRHFGGVPQEVLLDNARALVDHHDAATREVRFNHRLHALARYWGFRPRACARIGRAPRARTSAASATSSATPSPVMSLRAGRRSRRISTGGCARLPIGGCTVPPGRCRCCALSAMRLRRSSRSRADHPFGRCVSLFAACRPIVRSKSMPTATACLGGSSARACRSW